MLILLYMYNSTRMNSANVWHKKVWEGLAPCVNWFLMNYQNHKEPNKSNPHIYIKLSAWLAFLVNWCIINTRWTRNQPLPHISTATVKGLFGTLCELVLFTTKSNGFQTNQFLRQHSVTHLNIEIVCLAPCVNWFSLTTRSIG